MGYAGATITSASAVIALAWLANWSLRRPQTLRTTLHGALAATKRAATSTPHAAKTAFGNCTILALAALLQLRKGMLALTCMAQALLLKTAYSLMRAFPDWASKTLLSRVLLTSERPQQVRCYQTSALIRG